MFHAFRSLSRVNVFSEEKQTSHRNCETRSSRLSRVKRIFSEEWIRADSFIEP